MHFPALPDRSVLADWRRWLPVATEVVLVLLLAVQAGRIVWMFAGEDTGIDSAVGVVATAAASDAAAPALPSVDVFFRSAAPAASGGGAMGYRLFGVRRDGDGGSAILGRDDLQASYAVGREVSHGVVLESVGDDHAVLLAGGARHRLELPEAGSATAGSRRTTSRNVRADARTAAASTAASTPTDHGDAQPGRPAKSATPAAPASTTPARTAPVDVRKLVTEAGLRPNLSGGFTVSSGGDAALLKQAGLAPGDVLLAVDGNPLTIASASGLASRLQGRREVQLRFRRDGQVHTTILKAP